eukprot:UN34446
MSYAINLLVVILTMQFANWLHATKGTRKHTVAAWFLILNMVTSFISMCVIIYLAAGKTTTSTIDHYIYGIIGLLVIIAVSRNYIRKLIGCFVAVEVKPSRAITNVFHMPKERVEAFTDGVFAIMATLLTLLLKSEPPHGHHTEHSNGDMDHLVKDNLKIMLALIGMYGILCEFWLAHHLLLDLFYDKSNVDHWFNIFNGFLLYFVALVPSGFSALAYQQDKEAVIYLSSIILIIHMIFWLMNEFLSHQYYQVLEDR